jgi:hypothetical protein
MTKTYIVSEEVLRQVFDALMQADDCLEDRFCRLLPTIRAILASPPAEPVAWVDVGDLRGLGNGNSTWVHPEDQGRMIPLYRKDA